MKSVSSSIFFSKSSREHSLSDLESFVRTVFGVDAAAGRGSSEDGSRIEFFWANEDVPHLDGERQREIGESYSRQGRPTI